MVVANSLHYGSYGAYGSPAVETRQHTTVFVYKLFSNTPQLARTPSSTRTGTTEGGCCSLLRHSGPYSESGGVRGGEFTWTLKVCTENWNMTPSPLSDPNTEKEGKPVYITLNPYSSNFLESTISISISVSISISLKVYPYCRKIHVLKRSLPGGWRISKPSSERSRPGTPPVGMFPHSCKTSMEVERGPLEDYHPPYRAP